ncbi:hypothetical protein GUG52_08940, partial [Xanthomonas citri pv. citri]|nr:hypothetical protein [Xanthomonas citri pv. citri]
DANIDVIHAKAAVYRDNHRALKRAMDNLRNAKKRGEPEEVIERLEAVLVKARENPSGK